MIILKRFINEQALNAEYLITAVALYSKHRKYFADQGYTNHQTFDSMELLTMASNALPIVPEISQYEREPGLYLACGSQSIADFERLSTQEFLIRENGIDADGIIPISGTVLRITDP